MSLTDSVHTVVDCGSGEYRGEVILYDDRGHKLRLNTDATYTTLTRALAAAKVLREQAGMGLVYVPVADAKVDEVLKREEYWHVAGKRPQGGNET